MGRPLAAKLTKMSGFKLIYLPPIKPQFLNCVFFAFKKLYDIYILSQKLKFKARKKCLLQQIYHPLAAMLITQTTTIIIKV